MNSCKIIELTVDSLIRNTSEYLTNNSTNIEITNLHRDFIFKYCKSEHFISTFHITIYVNNLNKANREFSSKDILHVDNISKLYILKLYSNLNLEIKDTNVAIMFIVDNYSHLNEEFSDDEINKSLLLFENYAINIPIFHINSKIQHKNIEKQLLFSPNFYVKKAKKSPINSLYSFSPRIVFRLNKSNQISDIEEELELSNKYVNIKCPFCKKKFEITEKSIDNIITIEMHTKKISFNCLHKESPEVTKGKFFIDPYNDYSIDMSKYTDLKLQLFFLFNFNLIINKENERNFR